MCDTPQVVCTIGCMVLRIVSLKESSTAASKAPPFFIFRARGEQSPRAGEVDGEHRQPFLTDLAEGFSRLRERRRATAIRIERDRNETGDRLVAGDGLTRKCFISGDFPDSSCARDGGVAAGEMVTLFSLACRGRTIRTVGTTVIPRPLSRSNHASGNPLRAKKQAALSRRISRLRRSYPRS